ncbi:MAG: nucleoside-diphosphate kinase [Bacteroidetes bacterium]|nr:nucleoside-diphosphate kinase [Bacteroidota bacterium]MBL6963807.1 nucleoside-diphosphate kinase [Bacteroidota bacterium]
MSNRTFTIIKPEVVAKGFEGKVLDAFSERGFRVVALKKTQFSLEQASRFYAIHKDRPFFQGLLKYITSSPVVVAILEKENAVQDFRKLIGSTNPAEAEEGTIRKKFGSNIEQNAVHGSDSDENAQIEGSYFFSLFEQY